MPSIRIAPLLLAAVAACDDPSPEFRAAVILPSAIDDRAFSQSIYDALSAVRTERGTAAFEFAYGENVDPAEAGELLREFASEGYDLVIAHGLQYDAAVSAAARDFPDIAFALGTTGDTHGIANLYAYDVRADEGGYVNGVMAAKLSKSRVLGVVGPLEVGDAKSYVDGFVRGARDTVPGIDVRVTYVGSFDDVALATQAAQDHLNAGADVLTGIGQLSAGAIAKARENAIPWFGSQSDQSPLAPAVVPASAVYRWKGVIERMIDAAVQGARNRAFVAELANGGEEIVFNPAAPLPADVRALGDEAIDDLVSGTVQTALRSR